MKVLILGHGDHGKGTAAGMITDLFGLSAISSSLASLDRVVYPAIKEKYGYETREECYADRHTKRLEWKELITSYNTPDKGRLCREILAEFDCYDGMRCHLEFAATKHLFNKILWIDASQRRPSDPSLSIEYDRGAMTMVDNNGEEGEMFANLLAWGRELDLCY